MVRHALARGASIAALSLAVTAGTLIPLAATAAADGAEAPQELVIPPALKENAGTTAAVERLTLAQGELSVVDRSDDGAGDSKEWRRDLSTGDTLGYGARTAGSTPVLPCPEDDAPCGEYWATGDGRFVTRQGGYLYFTSGKRTDFIGTWVGAGARIRDVNGSYLAVDSGGNTPKQRIVALAPGVEAGEVLEERTPVAAALWGSWLWSADGGKGAVSAKDLKTGATVETLNTGADCVPQELQAAGRWIYWSCGANGPAGVYDRTAGKSGTVPSGEALLGDGYVVTHDKAAGKLVLTGTDTGKPAVSRVVGDLPDTGVSQRRVRWTVDRFGGHLAYADAKEQVHVVPSGIAPQPLVLLTREDTPSPVVDGFAEDRPTLLTSLTPSRPLRSWTLTARHRTTGKVSELASGTDGRWLRPAWNGRDKAGTLMPNGEYTWTLTARPDGPTGAETTVSGGALLRRGASPAHTSFTNLPPQRVLDTRNGTGVAKGKLGAKGTVTLDVSGVPGIGTAWNRSVALHVTATNASAGTFVSAYGADADRSAGSNLNVPAGKTVSNLIIAPVNEGKVTFYNHAGTVDLIADVAGVNKIGEDDSLYRPMAPWRALDTRSGLGGPKAKVKGGTRAHVTFVGTAVGGADVTAVVLNVTATNVTGGTFVTAVPQGGPVVGSHLNPQAGETRSNLVVVPVKDGGVDLYNHAGTVDLIADVAGYYTKARTGSLYSELPYGARLMDTRYGTGVAKAKVGAGKTVTLAVGGKAGIPATGATAVVLNVTATNTTAGTYVTAYPYGTTRSSASNLNVPAGATVSNLVVVPVKDGKVTFYNHGGTVDLIADVQGFYAE